MPDRLPPNFARNVVANYGSTVARMLSLLAVTPILLHELGDAAFGVWALAGSVILYLDIFHLGFGIATSKLVAEDAGRRDERVIGTINTSFFVLAGLGVLAMATGVVIAVFSASWFDVPDALTDETTIVFLILAINIGLALPGDTFGGVLSGYQRYDLLGLVNTFNVVGAAVAGVIVVLNGGGLVGLALATTGVSLLSQLLRYRLVRRLVPGFELRRKHVQRSRLRLTTRLSGWFLVRDAAELVTMRVDLVVLGAMRPLRDVALYAVGSKLALFCDRGVRPLATLFMPEVSALNADGHHDRVAKLYSTGTRVVLLAALPSVLILTILAAPLVEAWVGEGYATSASVALVLALGLGLRSLSMSAATVLVGKGEARTYAGIQSAEAAVNLVASVLLVGPLGPTGVALGTVVGVTAVNLPLMTLWACRVTGTRVGSLARASLVPHLPAAAVTAGALFAVRGVLDGRVAVVAASVVAFALYVGVYLGTGATPTERRRVRSLARRLSRRSSPGPSSGRGADPPPPSSPPVASTGRP